MQYNLILHDGDQLITDAWFPNIESIEKHLTQCSPRLSIDKHKWYRGIIIDWSNNSIYGEANNFDGKIKISRDRVRKN